MGREGGRAKGEEVVVRAAVKELLHERLLKPGRIVCPDALENEARWLEVMNGHGVGPKLLYADVERVVMEFVPGQRILEYLTEERDVEKCVFVLSELLRQLRLLDVLGIHKGELVKPGGSLLPFPPLSLPLLARLLALSLSSNTRAVASLY